MVLKHAVGARPGVAVLIAVLVLGACIAAAFGFVSPDSWEYLHLAQALRDGDGCTLRGAYFAVLPCGYPLLIALTAPAAGLAQLVVASKATNFLLLAGALLLLVREQRNALLPVLIVVNPVTMAIYQYTWSENLFLFALCATLAAVSRCTGPLSARRDVVWLAVALIVGCSARYFFGPFAALIFVGIWFVYGRALAWRVFPAFLAAGVFFLAYQAFNAQLSGHASGMPRVAAPETIAYLALRFANALAHLGAYFGVWLALLLALCARRWQWAPSFGLDDAETRSNVLLAWVGGAYLALAFALRASTHFDMYGTRTVGYGVVLLGAALVGLTLKTRGREIPAFAAGVCGVVALLAAHGGALPRLVHAALTDGYRTPVAALRDYRAPPTDVDVVIALGVPDVAPTIAGDARLYFAPPARALEIVSAPFRKAETLDELAARLNASGARSCAIDFHAFATRQAIEAYLARSYVIDAGYEARAGGFVETRRPSLNATLGDYLRGRFVAGRYVACDDLLSR